MTQSPADAVSLFAHETLAGVIVDPGDHPMGLGVLAQYRDGSPRPPLIFNAAHPVGVPCPESVLSSTRASERPPPRASPLRVKSPMESR
ncbi:hypothetical protein [Nesterenkonia sp. Act20]|uniref:hypothetical protein n=1 Tax=Nesterenkonia sp. Act20 TaxID=1483432 RepID=UPI001C468347|nr:hypothetical protein [Nesterenkonia sp. Act20]